jgi:ornithine cyclodeaminase
MNIVGLDTVRSLVGWAEAVDAMRAAFIALSDGRVVAPREFVMTSPAPGDIHVKGAYIEGSKWVVAKMAASGFPAGGNHGCFLVISAKTGAIDTCIDDGGWLTEARTAAAGALVTNHFARADATTVALIGTVVQAAFQLEALRATRPIGEVRVAARSIDRLKTFCETHGTTPSFSIDEALDGADIVICATTSKTAMVHRARPGTHVTSIGVDMLGKCELGADLIDMADVVVVDDIEVSRSVGMLQHLPQREVTTVGDVLAGRHPGRTSSDQITIVGLAGLGVQDAAIADLFMEANLRAGQ